MENGNSQQEQGGNHIKRDNSAFLAHAQGDSAKTKSNALEIPGDADGGWNLTIENIKAVPFNFLNKVRTESRNAYVVISYMAKS